jgi:hypothetical protein
MPLKAYTERQWLVSNKESASSLHNTKVAPTSTKKTNAATTIPSSSLVTHFQHELCPVTFVKIRVHYLTSDHPFKRKHKRTDGAAMIAFATAVVDKIVRRRCFQSHFNEFNSGGATACYDNNNPTTILVGPEIAAGWVGIQDARIVVPCPGLQTVQAGWITDQLLKNKTLSLDSMERLLGVW